MPGSALRPIGVSSVAMWLTKNQNNVSNARASRSSAGTASCRPRGPQHGPMLAGRHQRDLRARVAGPHDEDGPVAELRGAPELARVQLRDGRVELGGEVRDAGPIVGPRCDHDLARCVVAVIGKDPEAAAIIGRPDVGDADPRSDGQLEVGRIRLQVVGDLVFRREPVRIARERHPRQAVEAPRRERRRPSQRVRHASPTRAGRRGSQIGVAAWPGDTRRPGQPVPHR